MMTTPRLLVAVLVYDTESKTGRLAAAIKAFLDRQAAAQAKAYDLSLVVFDDASRDKSFAMLQEKVSGICDIKAASSNQGYGGSVKYIFDYAREHRFDYLCIFPGDLQRSFDDIDRLIYAALTQNLDVVTGAKDPSLVAGRMPLRRKYGNILIKDLTRLWGEKVTDPLAGFKCYKVFPCYKVIWLCQNRFGFDLDFSFWSTYLNLKKGEVPCNVSYHDHTSTIRSTTWQGIRFVMRALMLGFVLKPALRCLQYTSTRPAERV